MHRSYLFRKKKKLSTLSKWCFKKNPINYAKTWLNLMKGAPPSNHFKTILVILKISQFLILRYKGSVQKKNSGYNEFGTISLWTPPPTINSENWSQYEYHPSLKKYWTKLQILITLFVISERYERKINPNIASKTYFSKDYTVFLLISNYSWVSFLF